MWALDKPFSCADNSNNRAPRLIDSSFPRACWYIVSCSKDCANGQIVSRCSNPLRHSSFTGKKCKISSQKQTRAKKQKQKRRTNYFVGTLTISAFKKELPWCSTAQHGTPRHRAAVLVQQTSVKAKKTTSNEKEKKEKKKANCGSIIVLELTRSRELTAAEYDVQCFLLLFVRFQVFTFFDFFLQQTRQPNATLRNKKRFFRERRRCTEPPK